MIVYEILNFNREILDKISGYGIRLEDCKYIDLYSEYIRMRKEGEKITYIIAFLSEKYCVSERKVYSLIERLGKDCKTCAV